MAERKRLVAQAKDAGDGEAAKALAVLRKPSLAAWAVNRVARSAPEAVAQLADLGARMRAAQGRLDTATLTGLRPDRDRALEAFLAAAVSAVAEAGRTLSPAAQQDVRATAIAALADEQATVAVTSGQLTRALSYSGFGEVDLSEAVARTASGAILTVVRGGGPGATQPGVNAGSGGAGGRDDPDDVDPDSVGAQGEDGLDRLARLEAELVRAAQEADAAEQAVDAARERAEQTRERLGVVERQLAKAREADERALEAVTDAVRARKQAQAARHTAERAVAEARDQA